MRDFKPILGCALLGLAAGCATLGADRAAPPPSRVALRMGNLLSAGNHIVLALACSVETPLSDEELSRRGIDPPRWKSGYCAQSLSIAQSWARRFKEQGYFELLPLPAEPMMEAPKVSASSTVPRDALRALEQYNQATHLLLVQEKIAPGGRRLSELRILRLIDLETGEVLASDETRF